MVSRRGRRDNEKKGQAMVVKLFRTERGYQTEPVLQTGIGRFQVYKTDNANARAIGRNPRWTVSDLYRNVCVKSEGWERFDTLAEVKEWIEKRMGE